ncbi:MAG: RidA family protein [Bosea sp. (in: a-proteobacteria)]
MTVTPITAPDVPAPRGHYSHAVKANGFLFVSGQLGVREDGSHTADQPFETQARQTLDNLMRILKAAGCGPADVAKVTVYIVGMEHWALFNALYAEVFGAHRPARAVVPVNPLNYGYLVEVEAIAALPG